MNVYKKDLDKKKDIKSDEAAHGENPIKTPELEVQENEDASLQDDSYAFDESNTDNEEYHDTDDSFLTDQDFDDDQKFVI